MPDTPDLDEPTLAYPIGRHCDYDGDSDDCGGDLDEDTALRWAADSLGYRYRRDGPADCGDGLPDPVRCGACGSASHTVDECDDIPF